ncbi:hypothetical protein QYM36_013532 [Artemia franciscana]|uniref:Uncharacterized protein n=1 Tax=Artemia franciscana TaxID=6661 RepID=A0AA88HLK5_ARTSF|nr:hypothetical protein QYM36_013532 [Artemia franciscana]
MAKRTGAKQEIPWGSENVANLLEGEIYSYTLKEYKKALKRTDREVFYKKEIQNMINNRNEWLCITDCSNLYRNVANGTTGWELVVKNVNEKLNENSNTDVEIPEWISFWQHYCQPRLLTATITKIEEDRIKAELSNGTKSDQILVAFPERNPVWVNFQVHRILFEKDIADFPKDAEFALFSSLKPPLASSFRKTVAKLHILLPKLTYYELKVTYAEYQEKKGYNRSRKKVP